MFVFGGNNQLKIRGNQLHGCTIYLWKWQKLLRENVYENRNLFIKKKRKQTVGVPGCIAQTI